MASGLWSSTYDEVARNSNNSEHLGCQYDFYLDCVRDVMEEDALNEKSCIQALKNLITKEDTEIEELEKDLLSLQNELVWAEHQNWPEICCNALTQKINWLDVSIRSLKNDHADNARIQLLFPNEPAGTLDEVLKATLGDCRQDNCGQELLSKIVLRSADFGAIKSLPGPPDGMNLLGKSDFNVLAYEEVRRSQLVTTDKSQILNSATSKGKENVLKEVKQEGETVKDVTTDECLDSSFCQEVKSENSNFAPKTARRDCEKASNVAPTQDLDPTNLPLNRDCGRINPLQVDSDKEFCLAASESWNRKSSLHVMYFQSASLVNAGSSGSSSMSEMQTKKPRFTGSQLTDRGKSQVLCPKPEPTVYLGKSVMSEPGKLKNQRKRKQKSDSFSARDPSENPMEIDSSSSREVTCKRQRKSRTSIDGNLVESLGSKDAKRTVQLEQHETAYAIVPYDSKFFGLQKKRNVCKLPVTAGIQNSLVNIDLTSSNVVETDNGQNEDLQNCWSGSSVDSHNKTSVLMPVSLRNLTLSNLRAIAKQHNVKKYYRMTKGPLVEQLTQILGGR